jgi:purine-nucleoside phosphorylase
MYRSITASEYKTHFGLPDNYRVAGVIIYGTFKSEIDAQLKIALSTHSDIVTYSNPKHEFLEPIIEFWINNKTYWFIKAYGGAQLSEWLHLGCLFGSKTNILLGSCGGLLPGAKMLDIIIPTFSYGLESSAKTYSSATSNDTYTSDTHLSEQLAKVLEQSHKVHRGPTTTCQAMLGETWEHVQQWSNQGYFGVEMEAATVFAVSNHFSVKSAAMLVIGDNLIEQQTNHSQDHISAKAQRVKISQDLFVAALQILLE